MAGLERVEHRAHRDGFRHFKLHFAVHAREMAQMKWKHDANHGRVCTSTDKTPGRSRTMGFHELPPLAEA